MTKALVVEDDPEVMETIEDTLYSMGHDHDWVTNQHDARKAIQTDAYQYVLLDLQIPAKPNRGGANFEFGVNLLRDIHELKSGDALPVVIMTAYSADCLDLSSELASLGASEFISKPFHNKERSLARVIRKVVRPRPRSKAKRGSSTQQFSGGELVFHPGHVELLGVRIISDRGTGQCMMVLRELAQQDSHGRFVRLSSDELAAAIGATGGVGTITGCIQTLRGNIVSRLLKAGHTVGRTDVIRHDEQGYYLANGIVVQHQANQAAKEALPTTKAPDLSDRQQWVLEQLKAGIKIQRKALECYFDVSDKSAKRDLSQLVKRGLIEFVRAGRQGFYRLRR